MTLDNESSLLTTFNSPFGRYCFLRIPFGLVMTQDVFQQKMDAILKSCPGTLGIADDVAVFRRSEAEHDANLHNLMRVSREHGLVFNSKKCAIKAPQISFFGTIYDVKGVQPDPKNVEDIQMIPTPESRTELQEFLGIVTYMGSFVPNLSQNTAILRELLKKDADFQWSQMHQKAFELVKSSICKETTLEYFDRDKGSVIQVDAINLPMTLVGNVSRRAYIRPEPSITPSRRSIIPPRAAAAAAAAGSARRSLSWTPLARRSRRMEHTMPTPPPESRKALSSLAGWDDL